MGHRGIGGSFDSARLIVTTAAAALKHAVTRASRPPSQHAALSITMPLGWMRYFERPRMALLISPIDLPMGGRDRPRYGAGQFADPAPYTLAASL